MYFFRLYNITDDEVVTASSSNPSLVTEGAQVTFSSASIPSATVIEGITTDIATTPTSVPFGSVAIDAEVEGAQRLTIDTNGTEGYQVFVYGRQDLVSAQGDSINEVAASNTTPAAWSTGCSGSADGCFGYHTGDDTLSGGSTRFAPNDTYAALETTLREVAYSGTPAVSETVDIVYKVQVGDQQPAGQYESQIVYIIVPTF